MPFAHEHAARIREPGEFAHIVQIWASKSKGIRGLGGPLKSNPGGAAEVQAIHFKASKWSVAEARAWLKKNGYTPIVVEPASGETAAAQFDSECKECGYLAASADTCSWCGGEMKHAETEVESVVITAAAGGQPARVSGVAYSGGEMRLKDFPYPVVVDLAGVSVADSVALLPDHENRTSARLGILEAWVTARGVEIGGHILSTSETAQDIIRQDKAGGHWQLSIGGDPLEKELVTGQREVNGRLFTGPFYLIKRFLLREVSVTSVGADKNARLKIAATFHFLSSGDLDMKFNEWLKAKGFIVETLTDAQKVTLQAAYDAELKATDKDAEKPKVDLRARSDIEVQAKADPELKAKADPGKVIDPVPEMRLKAAAEVERIAAVTALCASYDGKVKPEKMTELKAKAIKDGWAIEKVELECLRAERPMAPAIHVRNEESGAQVIEAALCLGNGIPAESIVKSCGEKALDGARRRYGGAIGARQFVLEAAWANGFTDTRLHSGNLRSGLRAAFSTQAASDILSNVANKVLLAAYSAVENTWSRVAAIGPCNDFKAQTHYRLTGDMQYEEVGPTGELKHAVTGDESYSVMAKTYGKIFVLTRTDIINDDLGAFDQLRTMLGRGAALKINDVFWTVFMDNSSFFTGGRGNYISGATTTISIAGLTTADLAFANMKDSDGKPLGLQPKILLVPAALKQLAKQYMTSTNLKGDTDEPEANTFAGAYRLEVSSYLGNTSYAGNSALAWYLLVEPADMACIKVVFLDGKQTPTVESAEADFDQLGIQIRAYHDFGVSKAEYRAGLKSKGAA